MNNLQLTTPGRLIQFALVFVTTFFHFGVAAQKITAFDGASLDQFGIDVDIDGNYMVIGAQGDDDLGSNTGALYFYEKELGSWVFKKKLTPSGGASTSQLGKSVAISSDGNLAIAGAGSEAYVYIRFSNRWLERDIIDDTAINSNNGFGTSVDIDINIAIVGAPKESNPQPSSGAAYIFVPSGSSWVLQDKLSANDQSQSDGFGKAVAIQGDTAIISAPFDDVISPDAGAVYVFTKTGTTWSQQQKITFPGAFPDFELGSDVALDGDTFVATGGFKVDGIDVGAIYVFGRISGSWIHEHTIQPPTSIGPAGFGDGVDISGDTIVVGAPADSSFITIGGSAHVYTRSGSRWIYRKEFRETISTFSEFYGFSAAVSNDSGVAGIPADDEKGESAGAAHVFSVAESDLPPIPCPEDLNGDNGVDGADLGQLLGSWGGLGSADLNNDGTTDGADLGLLLGAWGTCP